MKRAYGKGTGGDSGAVEDAGLAAGPLRGAIAGPVTAWFLLSLVGPLLLDERLQLDTLLVATASLALTVGAWARPRWSGAIGPLVLAAWFLVAPELRAGQDYLTGAAMVHPLGSRDGWGIDPDTGLRELGPIRCGNDTRFDRYRSPRYDTCVRALARAFGRGAARRPPPGALSP